MTGTESMLCNVPSDQDQPQRSSNTSTGSIQERWKNVLVTKNRGFFAQPIKQVGYEMSKINSMLPARKHLPEVARSLFPRSVVYEIAYKKKQAELKIAEALRREREALAEKVKMKMEGFLEQNKEDEDENNEGLDKIKEGVKPFWYEEGKEVALPPSALSSYDVDKGMRLERPDDEDTKQRMGLDDDRNYIPGQFSGKLPTDQTSKDKRGDVPKDLPSQGFQTTPHPPLPYCTNAQEDDEEITETEKNMKKMESECHPKHPAPAAGLVETYPLDYMRKRSKPLERPKLAPGYEFGITDVKGKPCKDFPITKARLTTPWGHLRSEEFMKVGKPFKTEAARWYECTMSPFKPEDEIKAIRERLTIKYQDQFEHI